MFMYIELILLVFYTTIHTSAGHKSRQDVLKEILQNYDPDVYPNDYDGNQTEVTVQMTIADIEQINDQTQEFEMILYLRMEWYDPRLQFENETDITFTNIELTGDRTSKVWLPDLFFYDERAASTHGIMGPQKLIYIYKDGNIIFSERITMTTECVMDFTKFPFDEQNCIFHLESYAYTTRSLVLKWAEPYDVAVQNLDTNTPYFIVTHIKTTSGVNVWSSFSIYQENRNFSYLNATLTLERVSSVYGFTYFGTYPVYATMVLLSFGLKETGPRVTACSSAIAAVALQWIAVYSKLPSIPHYTVIDQWILGHMLFMWLAIVYHVLVHIWISTHEGQKSRLEEKSEDLPPEKEGHHNTADNSTSIAREWTITLKPQSDGKIEHDTDMTVKRSIVEFFIIDEYLYKGKERRASGDENAFISRMLELLHQKKYEGEEGSVVRSFITDKKWKCPTLFNIWARIKIYLPCCGGFCECCRECGSSFKDFITQLLSKGRDRCKTLQKDCLLDCEHRCECCCCFKYKKYAVFQEEQTDEGSKLKVLKDEQNPCLSRSFKDFYYLQTYLQAKYPDFKWPKLPLHNVLTTDGLRQLQQMREDYITEIMQLLQPNVWKHHPEIEKVMQTFTNGEEWNGSKWYSSVRIYILNFVDSAGHKTGPDLLAFIFFCFGYSFFVPFLLHDKWQNGGQLFYEIIPCACFLAVVVIVAKYVSVMPPTLWHKRARLEKVTLETENPKNEQKKKNKAEAKGKKKARSDSDNGKRDPQKEKEKEHEKDEKDPLLPQGSKSVQR